MAIRTGCSAREASRQLQPHDDTPRKETAGEHAGRGPGCSTQEACGEEDRVQDSAETYAAKAPAQGVVLSAMAVAFFSRALHVALRTKVRCLRERCVGLNGMSWLERSGIQEISGTRTEREASVVGLDLCWRSARELIMRAHGDRVG